jgi:hypothetical protein
MIRLSAVAGLGADVPSLECFPVEDGSEAVGISRSQLQSAAAKETSQNRPGEELGGVHSISSVADRHATVVVCVRVRNLAPTLLKLSANVDNNFDLPRATQDRVSSPPLAGRIRLLAARGVDAASSYAQDVEPRIPRFSSGLVRPDVT